MAGLAQASIMRMLSSLISNCFGKSQVGLRAFQSFARVALAALDIQLRDDEPADHKEQEQAEDGPVGTVGPLQNLGEHDRSEHAKCLTGEVEETKELTGARLGRHQPH